MALANRNWGSNAVSGLIATGVFALQLLLPLAIPIILVAFVTEDNSVLTWSSLGRFLQSSLWPTILGTDTTSITGVRKRIYTTPWFQTAALGILSIASIVTPLGLYDSIEPADTQTKEQFKYIQDQSAFGYGTPERNDAPFTRSCGSNNCPGASRNETCHRIGLLDNCTLTYDLRVPDALRTFFLEGASNLSPTVSSVFDVQWRTYVNGSDSFSLQGWYLKPAFRQLSILILDEKIQVVEGLVVDMETGGIGFRNHTVPKRALEYGSTWDEDLLFIQPETQCVNLNLTLDFELPFDNTGDPVNNLVLTDRGGFSDLLRLSPSLDVPSNGQTGIDLQDRAFKAAWLNNFLTLAYFNATDAGPSNITRLDVEKGQAFPIPVNSKFYVGYKTIQTNIDFGEYLNFTSGGNSSNSSSNPFGISKMDFAFANHLCGGSTVSSAATLNNTLVGCGLLYGAANRTDGGSPLTADPLSRWSVPIYSCASTVKAIIKKVAFKYNGTGLDALKVTSAKAKTYDNSKSLPVWGVENFHNMTLEEVQPIWGILGHTNSTSDKDLTLPPPFNISTTSSASLYLPGFIDQYYITKGYDSVPMGLGQNLPGVNFYTQALLSALTINGIRESYADYSGRNSLALYAKWQKLSQSADGAGKILDLVWTDVAANAVVGTKGWGLQSTASVQTSHLKRRAAAAKDSPEQAAMVPITVYHRKIRYHVPFAVPAIVILAIATGVLVAVVVLASMRKTGLRRLRQFLDATSVGRAIALSLWPKGAEEDSKEWFEAVKTRRVRVTRDGIVGEGEDDEPEEVENKPVGTDGSTGGEVVAEGEEQEEHHSTDREDENVEIEDVGPNEEVDDSHERP